MPRAGSSPYSRITFSYREETDLLYFQKWAYKELPSHIEKKRHPVAHTHSKSENYLLI